MVGPLETGRIFHELAAEGSATAKHYLLEAVGLIFPVWLGRKANSNTFLFLFGGVPYYVDTIARRHKCGNDYDLTEGYGHQGLTALLEIQDRWETWWV